MNSDILRGGGTDIHDFPIIASVCAPAPRNIKTNRFNFRTSNYISCAIVKEREM
jgi:hypothetical protein